MRCYELTQPPNLPRWVGISDRFMLMLAGAEPNQAFALLRTERIFEVLSVIKHEHGWCDLGPASSWRGCGWPESDLVSQCTSVTFETFSHDS